jgi:AraC-like DNA-binding protein/mannose-6-phosphate isomerase-like protein (cupin superfamily)
MAVMDNVYIEKYKDVPMLKMEDNKHGGLPFFISKHVMQEPKLLHRHEYMQINYVYRGKAIHVINNQEIDIIKGDIFVIPPYIPHEIRVPEGEIAEIYEFEFEPQFINENFSSFQQAESYMDFAYIEPFLVSESVVRPRFNVVGKIQVQVESILRDALKEYTERGPGYMLMIKSLLLKLLVLVGREFTADLQNSETRGLYDRHRDAIMGALAHIEEHYADDLTIEAVSKEFLLSQSYFSYLFKSITSKTFTEYLNGIRIAKAAEILSNTDKKVLDICYEVGFRNINHFNRMFRQIVGVSPTEYRKKVDEEK